MKILAEMLSYRRAHDSAGEAEFIARFIAPIAPEVIKARDGTIHAYVKRIGKSPAVFCAHTDSVHNRQNAATRQPVGFDMFKGEYFVNDPSQRDCLGADDAAGVYVLTQMIAANVPGLYVFFRGEERGGIGSGYVARHRAALFDNSRYAIQFDRRGKKSIITEMMCGRTCSDKFALSLADTLNMGHVCDNTGSFTDTANLAGILPECTNISIGYENEHSSHETLNADYVMQLTASFIRAFSGDAPALDIARMPGQYSDDEADAQLIDLSDDEIYDLAESFDSGMIARILISARDELLQSTWETLR